MFEKRNADFHDISRRLTFDSGVPTVGASSPQAGGAMPTVPLNLYQSDALFWMGGTFHALSRYPGMTENIQT